MWWWQALDDGVRGMKRNGRRLVISPPLLAYNSHDSKPARVAADAVVAFEIDVIRVC